MGLAAGNSSPQPNKNQLHFHFNDKVDSRYKITPYAAIIMYKISGKLCKIPTLIALFAPWSGFEGLTKLIDGYTQVSRILFIFTYRKPGNLPELVGKILY